MRVFFKILTISVFWMACGESNYCDDEETCEDVSYEDVNSDDESNENYNDPNRRIYTDASRRSSDLECSFSEEGRWALALREGEQRVALRCRGGVWGELKKDRLECSRQGYYPVLDDSLENVYCKNNSNYSSFTINESFGSFTPIRCSSTLEPYAYTLSEDGRVYKFQCIEAYYSLIGEVVDELIDGAVISGIDYLIPLESRYSCSSRLTLQDFDPSLDEEEEFDPNESCSESVLTSEVVSPTDISGSYLRRILYE